LVVEVLTFELLVLGLGMKGSGQDFHSIYASSSAFPSICVEIHR
jgi:hypothetical protein